jgi:small subunit ribosomal protein S6
MRDYEAMIVLDTKGKPESGEQLASNLGKEFEKAGAKLKQIDRLGLKKFPHNPRHVESGYFVNIFFQAEPAAVEAIKAKLRLNEDVYQQYYQAA